MGDVTREILSGTTTRTREIDRREFLKLSALAAVPVNPRAIGRAVQGRGTTSDPVVVVGAGLAGLRAAEVLRKAGTPVVVLEARSRPGGRVHTIRRPFAEHLYAEAGAIRIPPQHETVIQLAKEHGLNLVPFESLGGSALMTIRGVTAQLPDDLKKATAALSLKPEEEGLGQGALLQRYVGDLPPDLGEPKPSADAYAGWRAYDEVTWPAWLRSRGASDDAVALMTLGGDSRELSALYVLRQFALLQKTTQFYKIHGGMDQLPRAMARALGAIVRYNAEVVRIEQTDQSVELGYVERGRKKTVRASRAILAIPFSTLRRVEVRPAFSTQKAAAIADLPYFPATRFLLQCRSSFWQQAGLSGTARGDQPAEMWDCTYDLDATRGILGATVGGELGQKLAGMTRTRALTTGRQLVAQTFPKMTTSFERGSVYRWTLDAWARGAFAVFHPGQMSRIMPDIATPEGRIHFAGEHTSSWMGWMQGALESGERAANEVLEVAPVRRNAVPQKNMPRENMPQENTEQHRPLR
jgi:monoamine oxidase